VTACDFSFSRPSIASLHAAGITAVGRYVGPTNWGKTITQAEAASYHSASPQIAIWLTFEDTATDYTGGRSAGQANARLAVLNTPPLFPANQLIYFSVDTELTQPSDALAYFLGINDILSESRVGLYGEGALSDYLFGKGLITKFWESASSSFPGNSTKNARTAIWQRIGAPVPGTDLDVIYAVNYGQFPQGANPPPPPPPVTGPTIAAFIAEVKAQLGVTYVFGGDNPGPGISPPNGGFDCSGLFYYCARKVGYTDVPRTSEEQWAALPHVSVPQPGDLVFFNSHDGQAPPSHVGMIVNVAGTMMIDAPHTGTVVRYDSTASVPGVFDKMGYARLPGGSPTTPTPPVAGTSSGWVAGANP
jgi:cell wall-associated NlpC family hydrolase